MALQFSNPLYLQEVRQIVRQLSKYSQTTAQLETALPQITDMSLILRQGIKQGWVLRVGIDPDLWCLNRNMMLVNNQNTLLIGYTGDRVYIPPVITSLQINKNMEPFNNNPRNWCRCPE